MVNTNSLSAFNLILQADIVVQIVVISLLIASLVSWAIIFDKILKFRMLKQRSDAFEDYFDGGARLDEIYNNTKNTSVYQYIKNKVFKLFDYTYCIEIFLVFILYQIVKYFIF